MHEAIGAAEAAVEVHGDLIIGVAVAIYIIFLEGQKGCFQLVPSGGNIHIYSIQPLLIDIHRAVGIGPYALILGSAEDFPFHCCYHSFCFRQFLKHFLQVGSILLNERLHVLKQAIVLHIVGIRSCIEKQVRDFAAGEHSRLFPIPVSGNLLPFHLYVALILQIGEPLHGVKIFCKTMFYKNSRELNLFTTGAGFCTRLAFARVTARSGRTASVAAASYQRRGDHGAREECRKNSSFLHLFNYSFLTMRKILKFPPGLVPFGKPPRIYFITIRPTNYT